MFEGITVEPRFAAFFLQKLTHKPSSISDLKSLDPYLYKQLNFLRNYSEKVEDLGLYFSMNESDPVTGQSSEVELIEKGSEIAVDGQNKFRYISLVTDFKLSKQIHS
jgi:ubiquitin-protein ligase E3 C